MDDLTRLVHIFHRTVTQPKLTKAFSDLKGSDLDHAKDIANSHGIKNPIIFYYISVKTWLIVSLEKLVWCNGGDTHTILIDNIYSVDINLMINRRSGFQSGQGFKVFTIKTNEGQEYNIEMESGSALQGVVNVISSLVEK